MIPRIAHFHWEGQPMPWLRMMGIYTFIRLNPDWEVRLHRTPEHIRRLKLPSYGNEADLTWLEVVHKYGGFAVATDTVFVNPMPERWLDSEFCGCTNEKELGWNTFYHCCFGAVPGHEFPKACLDQIDLHEGPIGYQTFGIDAMRIVTHNRGGFSEMLKNDVSFSNYCEMSSDAFTPYNYKQVPILWGGFPLKYSDDTVGVTWFGGAPKSVEFEADAFDMNDAPIVALAKRMAGPNGAS